MREQRLTVSQQESDQLVDVRQVEGPPLEFSREFPLKVSGRALCRHCGRVLGDVLVLGETGTGARPSLSVGFEKTREQCAGAGHVEDGLARRHDSFVSRRPNAAVRRLLGNGARQRKWRRIARDCDVQATE